MIVGKGKHGYLTDFNLKEWKYFDDRERSLEKKQYIKLADTFVRDSSYNIGYKDGQNLSVAEPQEPDNQDYVLGYNDGRGDLWEAE